MHRQAIKTLVPEDVYTDRQEFIDYYYNYALKAIHRRAMSSVLLGQRRMGKTEIFKRVVNRLFFEQDHTDPKAVVPVYFSFPDKVSSPKEFAIEYIDNFIRWYAAFRLRQPDLLSTSICETPADLAAYVRENLPLTKMFATSLNLLAFENLNPQQPQKTLESGEQSEATDILDEVISRHIRRVLSKTKGKVNGPDGAAALLGMNPSTLRNRMKKLMIDYGRKNK